LAQEVSVFRFFDGITIETAWLGIRGSGLLLTEKQIATHKVISGVL
jgi:hypothetical protein